MCRLAVPLCFHYLLLHCASGNAVYNANIITEPSGHSNLFAARKETAKIWTISPALEQGLRSWWGNTWYGEFQNMIDQDKQEVGYELFQDRFLRIAHVMNKTLEKHLSGDACTSLPVDVSLHAWRYKQRELDLCLNMTASEGSTCKISCKKLPELSTILRCSKNTSGWHLVGMPPRGQCRWALDAQVVVTTGGQVQGLTRPLLQRHPNGTVSREFVRTFWGIRYAQRPIRFGLAEPLSKPWGAVQVVDYWDVDRNDSLRMHCADGVPRSNTQHGTEDCLFLDVHVPPGASLTARKPVLVWLFAAGFLMGDAWQQGGLDGARLAARQDAIVVLISSRTAAFGHWAHPSLSREYGDGSAGNMGERDQRLALRWIQTNIMKFGGDPGRVTLAGHSSGAFDAFFHLLSPHSQGLMHGMILESAALDTGWYWQDKQQAFHFYAQLGEALGCAQDNGSGEQVACLRSLAAHAFLDFFSAQLDVVEKRLKQELGIDASSTWGLLRSLFGVMTHKFEPGGLEEHDSHILANPLWPLLCFGLIVDGTDTGLPATPRSMYEGHMLSMVPVYLNHESDEGSLFALPVAALFPWENRTLVTHAAIDAILTWAFGGNQTFTQDLLQKFYPGTWTRPPMFRLVHAITDAVFKCPNRRFANAVSQQHPGSVFWAEHTFFESNSTNVISALSSRDAQWFLGANHCLPTSQLFGFTYTALGDSWSKLAQKNHVITNCHYSLMIHCGNPGATPGTSACLAETPMPRACIGLSKEEVYPFHAYDHLLQARHQLNPLVHGPIIPSTSEQSVCDFWDGAPHMSFQDNNCRDCRTSKDSPDVAVGEQIVI